jgi:Zn-dependent protease with chaperone function
MSHLLYLAHGATLALAWFLLVNVAASVPVAHWARRASGERRIHSAAFWFGLRLLPAVAAVAFVAAVFLPSYWKYEPPESAEGFDVTLTALAIGALALWSAACARGLSAWWSAARRTRLWLRNAHPISLAATPIPAFEIDVEAPMLALTGVLRPRLFVTRGLVEALAADELDASVAHELGHSRAADNLKRLAMRAAPDLLAVTRAARAIEGRWASASEHSADRLAGDASPMKRCALASALVKVARLTPPAVPPAEPISTLVGGGEIASRVQRLLDDRAAITTVRDARRLRVGLAIACAMLVVTYAPLLRVVHRATEALVHVLP